MLCISNFLFVLVTWICFLLYDDMVVLHKIQKRTIVSIVIPWFWRIHYVSTNLFLYFFTKRNIRGVTVMRSLTLFWPFFFCIFSSSSVRLDIVKQRLSQTCILQKWLCLQKPYNHKFDQENRVAAPKASCQVTNFWRGTTVLKKGPLCIHHLVVWYHQSKFLAKRG